MSSKQLTDEALIARVKRNCAADARLLAFQLIDLIDIEERGIHLREACSSMQEYCKRKFGMSPSKAWRRATAARLVRRIPILLEFVRRGEIDLSTLLLLRHHIDETNAEELIRSTRCKSKRQVERHLESLRPSREVHGKSAIPQPTERGILERLEAINEELYLLETQIRNETRILIERARFLSSSTLPHGSLAELVHRAFVTLVETLEAALAEARAKHPTDSVVKPGYISRALRYEIFVRDGFRCSYVSPSGERCRSTLHLQVDHIVPQARGGSDEPDNLRCVCGPHNQHYANVQFGKRFVRSRIRTRQAERSRTSEDRSRRRILARLSSHSSKRL